jgi:hypothetical protein
MPIGNALISKPVATPVPEWSRARRLSPRAALSWIKVPAEPAAKRIALLDHKQ